MPRTWRIEEDCEVRAPVRQLDALLRCIVDVAPHCLGQPADVLELVVRDERCVLRLRAPAGRRPASPATSAPATTPAAKTHPPADTATKSAHWASLCRQAHALGGWLRLDLAAGACTLRLHLPRHRPDDEPWCDAFGG
ncbi:MAG: hypothetical protein ACPGUV_03845 [Polyangiales bacterium]